MNATNPYECPESATNQELSPTPRRTANWVMTGFLVGALIPIFLGIYSLYRQRVYAASLQPGEALCGMAALAAFMTMFVGGPIFGIVGGFVGWIASKVRI